MKVPLFAILMLNAHEGYLCLQPWCSMHIHHEGSLSFASSMPNVHVSSRGYLAADGMQRRFSGLFCAAAVSFNVCCSNLLQRMDWVSEKKKMHCCERFTDLSLLLLLLQCNQTLDSQRKVSLLTKNSSMERVLGRRSWFATLDCGGQGYSRICLLCSCVQWTQREEAVDKKRKQTWRVGSFL